MDSNPARDYDDIFIHYSYVNGAGEPRSILKYNFYMLQLINWKLLSHIDDHLPLYSQGACGIDSAFYTAFSPVKMITICYRAGQTTSCDRPCLADKTKQNIICVQFIREIMKIRH